MAKKIKKVRIFDPISGKYKIVNETPEIKDKSRHDKFIKELSVYRECENL